MRIYHLFLFRPALSGNDPSVLLYFKSVKLDAYPPHSPPLPMDNAKGAARYAPDPGT